MKLWTTMLLVSTLVAFPAAGHAYITFLDAHFNDITPDVPIGTGGATVGEPVQVSNISAFVSNFCFGSPCLTISDESPFLGKVKFDHLYGSELDEGTIVVQFELAVDGTPPPSLMIQDKDGLQLVLLSFLVAPYATVDLMSFQFVIYYPSAEYDMYIDNDPIVLNNPLSSSKGVSTIQFYDNDSDTEGFMMVDNIKIVDLDDTYTGVPNGSAPLTLAASPNPFRESTTIRFSTAQATPVRLSLYDVRGRLVRELSNDHRPVGNHALVWDGRDSAGNPVSPGVYFSQLHVGDRVETKRITLVR